MRILGKLSFMVGLIFGETGRGGGITGHNPESSPCGVLIRGSYTTDWTQLQARTMSGIIMISEKQAFIVTSYGYCGAILRFVPKIRGYTLTPVCTLPRGELRCQETTRLTIGWFTSTSAGQPWIRWT